MATIEEKYLPGLKVALIEVGLRADDFSVVGRSDGVLNIVGSVEDLSESRLQGLADLAATKNVTPDPRPARKRELLAKPAWTAQERDEILRMILEENLG